MTNPEGVTIVGIRPTGTTFYTFDERGNTAQRIDAGGNVLSSHVYDAYGVGLSLPASVNDPYLFGGQAGYYTDGETGLVLCTFRYYDPVTGRWLTRDPAGYGGGMNLYAYCYGNPANALDPLGLCGDAHDKGGRDIDDIDRSWLGNPGEPFAVCPIRTKGAARR